ncbi:TPA_asm: maturation protein, partial [ssRNA phage Zoerhiza.1_31]
RGPRGLDVHSPYSRLAFDHKLRVLPLERCHTMAHAWTPKVIYLPSCTLVGASKAVNRTSVCSGSYEALIVSEPHHRLITGAWSGGGPFYCWKRKLLHLGRLDFSYRNNSVNDTYTILGVGPVLNPAVSAGTVPAWTTKQSELAAAYATGYKRARPGNPVASLGQFLVELRDLPAIPFKRLLFKKGDKAQVVKSLFKGQGIPRGVPIQEVPRLLLRQLMDFRSLGSEYLNVVFGWKPFVSDVRKMYNLWYDIDKRMAQIIRENGKNIRRKAKISEDRTVSQDPPTLGVGAYLNVAGAPPNSFGSYNYGTGVCVGGCGRSLYTVTRTSHEKVWFSGSFHYYIPDVSSSLWDKRARLALFGALPTPELLWEVLPWSWLIDWFSNIGDVISNASQNAVDNLTCRYSFVMKQVVTETEYKCISSHKAFSVNNPPFSVAEWPAMSNTWTTTETITQKMRAGGGNPFGLNVQLSSLSSYQLGILAALGLSRGLVK